MSDIAAGPQRLAPEWRIAFFYFTQMMPLGVAVVYAGIWFASKGISTDGIGIINSLPVLIMITLNLTIGRIADRASDWRQVIVTAATVQGFVTLGLFFVNEFWGILAVWTLLILPNQAIGPVADAATMRLTKRRGTSFGPIRACATLGYTMMVALTGLLIAQFGGGLFVPLFVGLSILKAVAAQALPQFRAPAGTEAAEPGLKGAARLVHVMRPWFVLPILGYAMVFGTHIILNAFAALLWKAQGIPESTIAPLLTVGALAEASMMFAWARLGPRISPAQGLLIASAVAVLRWTAMGFAPPVEVLFGLQLLHAITFAMGYLSVVHFISQHTSERIAAEAQSFYVVLQQAMSVIAVIGFGWLTGRMGIQAYWVAAGFALIGMSIIGLSIGRERRERLA